MTSDAKPERTQQRAHPRFPVLCDSIMSKILKNTLIFICILSMLLPLALAGCGNAADTPAQTETDKSSGSVETETEGEKVTLVGADGKTDYIVIRSDFSDSGSDDIKAAVALLAEFKKRIPSSQLSIKTDYEKETELEILVGQTNRKESTEIYETLGDHEYTVRFVGDKLVILGKTKLGTLKAWQLFLEIYGSTWTETVSVPKNINLKESYAVSYKLALPQVTGATLYDTVLAEVCIQGIMNRESDSKVYIMGAQAEEWFDIMTSEGRWLSDEDFEDVKTFEDFLKIGLPYLKKVIIWDTAVPASVNVATTIAGVEDGIVMSDTLYEKYQDIVGSLPVTDLRGMFDGSVTGSKKNDCYAWAIENYLKKGLCSEDFICYYTDSATERNGGVTSYVSVRDWAVYNRSFVFDLSPWSDEAPYDEPDQPIGADYNSFISMLSTQYDLLKQKKTYEVCGFFNFTKYSHIGANTTSKHETVPTEWETVYLISAYGGYQNTATEWCWNQSLHSQYEYGTLKNNRPDTSHVEVDDNKTYLCIFMADYDSSYPLYEFLRNYWKDPKRGTIPLAWGINPTLLDTYPDIISYYYETATENDIFTSDASAAGYFNPSRVPDEFWDTMIQHNKDYFEQMDLSIAPMVLDWDQLDNVSLDAFSQFAPDGVASIVIDFHGQGGHQGAPYLYDGSLVYDVLNNGGISRESTVEEGYNILNAALGKKKPGVANFLLTRCVWCTPSYISDVIDLYRERHPEVDLEVVDIYTYFELRSQFLA